MKRDEEKLVRTDSVTDGMIKLLLNIHILRAYAHNASNGRQVRYISARLH